jgi:DNA polymerase elongation subunit (family B)
MNYCKIDPKNTTIEEIKAEINRLTLLMNQFKNEEQSIKIFINSCYGALASPYFIGYNVRVAEAITLQGQEVRAYASKIFNRYFMEFWHRDKELHAKLGITRAGRVTKEVAIYGDTDSVLGSSLIRTDNGDITIEDLYNESCVSAGDTLNGHESVECEKNILNWTEKLGLHYSQPKRIIRHKVSKPKWRLRTVSGKEIIVTNDHSMIVFRNGKKLEIKPSEIIKTDKILSVSVDI